MEKPNSKSGAQGGLPMTAQKKNMMSSNGKTKSSLAGNPEKVNPATGSDRVKASVAGVGSMVWGRSQSLLKSKVDPLASNATRGFEDLVKTKLWEAHEHYINKLFEHLDNGRRNVNNDTHKIARNLRDSFKKMVELEKGNEGTGRASTAAEESESDSKISLSTPPFVRTLRTPIPPRKRAETETSVPETEVTEDNESDTGSARFIRHAKRRQRSSPNEDGKTPKKKKEGGAALPEKRQTKDPDWQTVGKNGKKSKEVDQGNTKLRKERVKTSKAAKRPNALIVRPKDKTKYAEVLRRVKKDVTAEQAAACVDKLRKTTTGDLLIVLTKGSADKGHELQKTIADLLGEEAEVISKGPQEELEIQDIEEDSTKESVLAGLRKAAGEMYEIGIEVIKSLRKAYRGTQIASVTLPVEIAEKIIGERGRVRIDWTNCRVRRVERPVKCFKCWHYGHLATRCTSTVDRSKLCTKCGEDGHKAASCEKEARCALCIEKGMKNSAHVAGSNRCPVYKEAYQKVRNKR